MTPEPLTVTKNADGSQTVQEWLKDIIVSPYLMFDSDGLIESGITVRAENGTRRYRITDYRGGAFTAELVEEKP